jgi:hypothetical protein
MAIDILRPPARRLKDESRLFSIFYGYRQLLSSCQFQASQQSLQGGMRQWWWPAMPKCLTGDRPQIKRSL